MSHSLTLFLDLREGTKPDLAVVAKAALKFDHLVKELAFQIDPTVTVRLDLESGTQGSLKLNSWLKSAKDKALDPKVQWAIVIGVLIHFGDQAAGYITTKLFEEAESQLLGEEQALSEDEIKSIADQVAERLQRGAGRKEAAEVFEELQADENITGVGVSPLPDTKPSVVIPRTEFSQRSRLTVEEETTGKKRTKTETVEALLLIPVLQEGNRRWKFVAEGVEFGAPMKDQEFLSNLIAGRHHIEMRGGIRMTIVLETVEEFDGKVWIVKERNVTKVLRTEAGETQIEFPSSSQDSDNNNQQ
ncbi:hypothetical protein [Ostreiculturibacter nitratireducens]|uniref:hypothetical protein n=1 Tax=Ostreiculturibacter nitratireducens TaxID=3075226 RepID=UPI0031B5727F